MNKQKYVLVTLILCLGGFLTGLSGQNIFWIESAFESPMLIKSDADGSTLDSLLLAPGSQPQGLSYDNVRNRIYWNTLDFNNAQILSSDNTLSSISVILDSLSVLRGLAINEIHNKIYWTATNLVTGPVIGRADANGGSAEILIDFGPASDQTPRSIGLDISAGKMYWTDFGAGKIRRADMVVGAAPEDVVVGLNGPSGIAVDTDAGMLFWTEMNGGQIKSSDLDGNTITVLIDGLSYPNFLSVNRIFNKMAWTETGTSKIKSAALDGTGIIEYAVDAQAPAGILIEPPPLVISGELNIIPEDTVVQVHNPVDFDAQILASNGLAYDTDADWRMQGDRIGPVSENGQVFTYFPGTAKLFATKDTMSAEAALTVVDTTEDTGGMNTISIVRQLSGHGPRRPKTINEGEQFILGGIRHPYNILNGAAVYFPRGSLHEDITLKIEMPKMVHFRGDSIDFANDIINGISFKVYVGDSLAEPYYFDKPVSIALPFKRGILKRFGIAVSDLGLYFATDSVTFDSLGISHVMVDSVQNRVYGLVEHFSALVIREKLTVTSVESVEKVTMLPEKIELYQNYPNPFNPSTTISYRLGNAGKVELSIYNIRGQKVATLVSSYQQPGNYQVRWNASEFVSGVYLYRLKTDQGFVQTRKLIYLK